MLIPSKTSNKSMLASYRVKNVMFAIIVRNHIIHKGRLQSLSALYSLETTKYYSDI